MVLHTTIISNTAGTGAGTEDTYASTAFYPAGDNEIQARGGGLPLLIGHSGVIADPAGLVTDTGGNYYKIMCNTWETARYIKAPWKHWAVATGAAQVQDVGSGDPVDWIIPGIPLEQDADWDVRYMTTSANVGSAVALYMSYGTPIPWNGGSDTWRMKTAGAALTANTWGNIGTITDLDPRFTYRINEIRGVAGITAKSLMAVRISSSSNNTYVGAVCNQCAEATAGKYGPPWNIKLLHDSILVSGVESVVIEGLSDGADVPSCYVGFRRVGTTAGGLSAPTPTMGTGGVGGFNISNLGRLLGR